MRCGQCGALVGEGYRFCEDCGAPVGVCPACGESATPGKRFCHSCGSALFEPASAPAAAAPLPVSTGPGEEPVAERRMCSMLFCDVGFALLDAHQPRHLASVLRAERDLVLARLAARDGETAAAASCVDEARTIGSRLACRSPLDRAAAMAPAEGLRA